MVEFLKSITNQLDNVRASMHFNLKSFVEIWKLWKTRNGDYNEQAYSTLVAVGILYCVFAILTMCIPPVLLSIISTLSFLAILAKAVVIIVIIIAFSYLAKKFKQESMLFALYPIIAWLVMIISALMLVIYTYIAASILGPHSVSAASRVIIWLSVSFFIGAFVDIFFCGTALKAINSANENESVLIKLDNEPETGETASEEEK